MIYGTGRKQTATVTKINQISAIFAVVVVTQLKIRFVVLANTDTLLFTVKQQALYKHRPSLQPQIRRHIYINRLYTSVTTSSPDYMGPPI